MSCPTPPGPRPTFIPVLNTARTVMRYDLFGQVVENVHYFRRTGGYTAVELDALNAAIVAAWTTTIRNTLPAACTLLDVTSTDQEVAGGAQDIDIVGAAGANTVGPFETPGNTFVIKFGTGLSGRSNRGRMFWPVLLANEVNDGKLSATWAASLRDAAEDFFTAILADSGDTHVIASYMNDCEWRTTGQTNDVTSYSYVDLNLDSQRRRLPGRGI